MYNAKVYNAFKTELIKQATVGSMIGKAFGKGVDLAVKHPKTAIGIGAAGILIPAIAKHSLPTFLIGSEVRKHNVMNAQTTLMQKMLDEQRKANYKPEPPKGPKLLEKYLR